MPMQLTDRSQVVLSLAEKEAKLMGHNFIGTEHLLLALEQEGSGIAANVLEELGGVRKEVFELLGMEDKRC